MVEYRIDKHWVVKRGDGMWYIETYDVMAQTFYRATTDLWNTIEPFDSFIKAVAWLKRNHTTLL